MRRPRTLGAKVREMLQVAGPAMVPTQVWPETAKSLLGAPSVRAVMEPTVTTSPAGTEKTRVVTPEMLPRFTPPRSTGPPGESDCAEAEVRPTSASRTDRMSRTSRRGRKGVRVLWSSPLPAIWTGSPYWRERAPLGVCIPILHPAAREPVLRGATVGRGVALEELAPERALPKKLSGKLMARRMMRCSWGPWALRFARGGQFSSTTAVIPSPEGGWCGRTKAAVTNARQCYACGQTQVLLRFSRAQAGARQ